MYPIHPYGPQTYSDTVFHNTSLLLERYRSFLLSVNLNARLAKQELNEEFGTDLNTYLSSFYGAGFDGSDRKIEANTRSLDFSRKLIGTIDTAVDVLRNTHVYGELYYSILHESYLVPEKYTSAEIISKLNAAYPNHKFTYNSYYRNRRRAIAELGKILWGTGLPVFGLDCRIPQ